MSHSNSDLYVVLPFCVAPYNKRIRFDGQWWRRKSYFLAEALEQERCFVTRYLDLEKRIVALKKDISPAARQHVLEEFEA